MSEERAPARRVVLKGLAAGAVYSLAWVLSNHWFFHQWNRHYLGVYLLVFLASLLSWFILDRLDGTPWRISYCIAFLFPFLFCFFLWSSASESLLRFLFHWHPSHDPYPDFSADGVFRISSICFCGKILTFVHTLFFRDVRKCLNE